MWCATSTQLNGLGGLYCGSCDIAMLVPKERETSPTVGARSRFSDAIRQVGSRPLGVMPYAVDSQAAERLWNLGEQLMSGNHHRVPASS